MPGENASLLHCYPATRFRGSQGNRGSRGFRQDRFVPRRDRAQRPRPICLRLLLMPGQQDVSLALAAGVIDQCEGQSVFVGSAELVDARAFAAFRSLTTRFLDRNRVGSDCVLAPDVAFRINDIECAVGLDCPDSAKRVSPCSGERGRTGARSGYTSSYQRDQRAGENDSERVLYFHGHHPVWSQLGRSSSERSEG